MQERLEIYIQNNPRRFLKNLILGFVLVFLAVWAIHYFTTGTVDIKTDSHNLIELSALDGTKKIKESRGELKATVSAGQYLVTVSSKSSATKQVITIQLHKTTNHTINLRNVAEPEPVLPFGAFSIVADKSKMLYIDARDHLLYRINGPEPPALLNPDITFNYVRWQSTGYGVGLSADNQKLYSINDGVIAPLNLPFSYSRLYFDLPTTGSLVVSDGKSVYRESPGADLSKIFSSSKAIESIRAGNSNILIAFHSATGDDDSDILIITNGGQRAGDAEGVSVYNSSWSPDGTKLAITSDHQTVIYNEHLKLLVNLPDANVLGLTWLNNTTVLYGVGDSVFGYDVGTSTSSQIAITPPGASVSGISPDLEDNRIYALAQTVGGNQGDQSYSVVRMNLDKPAPRYIDRLAVFLPISLDQCYVSYVNFSGPLVIMTPFSDGLAESCLQVTKSNIGGYGLDLGTLNFYMAPVASTNVD